VLCLKRVGERGRKETGKGGAKWHKKTLEVKGHNGKKKSASPPRDSIADEGERAGEKKLILPWGILYRNTVKGSFRPWLSFRSSNWKK